MILEILEDEQKVTFPHYQWHLSWKDWLLSFLHTLNTIVFISFTSKVGALLLLLAMWGWMVDVHELFWKRAWLLSSLLIIYQQLQTWNKGIIDKAYKSNEPYCFFGCGLWALTLPGVTPLFFQGSKSTFQQSCWWKKIIYPQLK